MKKAVKEEKIYAKEYKTQYINMAIYVTSPFPPWTHPQAQNFVFSKLLYFDFFHVQKSSLPWVCEPPSLPQKAN